MVLHERYVKGTPTPDENLLFHERNRNFVLHFQRSLQASRIVQNNVLDDPQIQNYDHKSGGYFSFFRNYSRLFAGAPYFPFHANMREMVAPYIHQVIQGHMTPGDALDEAHIHAARRG